MYCNKPHQNPFGSFKDKHTQGQTAGSDFILYYFIGVPRCTKSISTKRKDQEETSGMSYYL
jgi:hypothetical protein